jgi:hypothetical protein
VPDPVGGDVDSRRPAYLDQRKSQYSTLDRSCGSPEC